jgi:Na+/H+-dicarboxylate symporter
VVPDNVAAAAVDMNVLGLITFSLMLGLALSSLGACAGAGRGRLAHLPVAAQHSVAVVTLPPETLT